MSVSKLIVMRVYHTWTKNERNVLQFSILRVNAGDTVDGVCGGVGVGGGGDSDMFLV